MIRVNVPSTKDGGRYVAQMDARINALTKSPLEVMEEWDVTAIPAVLPLGANVDLASEVQKRFVNVAL